jgi:putative ABC transport system substrate-binding protein
LGYVFDYNDIGTQSAEIIIKIANGNTAGSIAPQRARKVNFAINMKMANYLNIKIAPDVIKEAAEIIN